MKVLFLSTLEVITGKPSSLLPSQRHGEPTQHEQGYVLPLQVSFLLTASRSSSWMRLNQLANRTQVMPVTHAENLAGVVTGPSLPQLLTQYMSSPRWIDPVRTVSPWSWLLFSSNSATTFVLRLDTGTASCQVCPCSFDPFYPPLHPTITCTL